jgi:hypothetical protein
MAPLANRYNTAIRVIELNSYALANGNRLFRQILGACDSQRLCVWAVWRLVTRRNCHQYHMRQRRANRDKKGRLMASLVYTSFYYDSFTGAINCASNTFKAMLVTSSVHWQQGTRQTQRHHQRGDRHRLHSRWQFCDL